jgi:acetylglutamate kinase
MSRILVKAGGAVVEPAAARALGLHDEGHEVCVVHGAGPQISAEMARRGLEVAFVRGRRVTSAAALEVVRESLAQVNAALCATIGPLAVGLMGDDAGLEAVRVDELGFVGDPVPSRPETVVEALERGLVPVVAPLARGPLNVNADEAAVALAAGLRADRILFLTDVPGLLRGGETVPVIRVDDAERLLGENTLEGGIVPKLEAAVRAARLGLRAEIGETAVVAEPTPARALTTRQGS